MSTIIMEEHYQAYFAWKARGIKNAWCWHVDAHLDIGRVGLEEKRLATLKDCSSFEEAKKAGCTGNSYLPWGGLHCGNYLYPAIKEGIVSKLTWVYPPDLPESSLLSWARHHLNEWFEISPDEFRSLEASEGKVTGTILGIPFEMGTLESLTIPTEPVLLDIDVDYFLEEDGKVWQEATEFAEAIRSIESLITTVAYSVKGGFTPYPERRLAEPWMQGEYEVMGEPDYQERPLDKGAALVRCHHYEDAVQHLDGKDDVESAYLRGSSLHALKRFQETLDVWEDVLQNHTLPPDGQHYLLNLCCELLLSLERPEDCLEYALRSQKLNRKSYAPCWTEAVAREKLGQDQKCIKALRKAVRLSEESIYGLKIRNALVRAYRRQNKHGLAVIESQKMNRIDPDQKMRGFALLGLL